MLDQKLSYIIERVIHLRSNNYTPKGQRLQPVHELKQVELGMIYTFLTKIQYNKYRYIMNISLKGKTCKT